MRIERYYLKCLSHASYMVIDDERGEGAVIDPQRDIEQYLKVAEEQEIEIRHVILTHFHADFVAGHIELRDRCGAKIYLGAKAEAEFEFEALEDGDCLEFGSVKLEAMETPGHTPEGISIVAYDKSMDEEKPYAVFTGDTLFLGDVGRPDLMASIGVTADELGRMLYHSLHEKLLKLPDETLVYPAHGAGSMCGKQLSDEEFSPLGDQKKYNYALQPMTEEKFVAIVTADQPEAPAYFLHDAMLNRQERSSLDVSLSESLTPLRLEVLLGLASEGAQIVDTRSPTEFAGAHLRGSINIGVDGKYATWAGTLLDKTLPIVIVAEQEQVEESIMRLGRIGFDQVRGYLSGGMTALSGHDDLVSRTDRITTLALNELLPQVHVIDVRTEKEWAAGHIRGSHNIPLHQLSARIEEVPETGKVAVHCQSGYRSSIAMSLLDKGGYDNARDVVGGIQAWMTSSLPLVQETPEAVVREMP